MFAVIFLQFELITKYFLYNQEIWKICHNGSYGIAAVSIKTQKIFSGQLMSHMKTFVGVLEETLS